MSTLIQQLALYATYHRDQRNIATHCLGIPIIVFGLDILLARPLLFSLVVPVTPALLLSLMLSIYYLRSSVSLGLVMTVALLLLVALAHPLAMSSTGLWLTSSLTLLVIGWALQFIGHYYEGRKPAFFDDLRGLLIGPGFIAVELLTRLGLFRELAQEVKACEMKTPPNQS